MSPTPDVPSSAVPPPSRTVERAGIVLAAVLLVALAFPAVSRLARSGLPRWLAVAAVALAVLAVLAGVGALLLRGATARTQAALAGISGALLLAATALAGGSAVAVLAEGSLRPAAAAEGLTVVVSGVGEDALLTVRAEMPDVAVGDLVRAEVVAASLDGGRTVLASQLTVARSAGTVAVTLQATAIGANDTLQVLVESPGRRCTASLRPVVAQVPTASCKAR